MLGSGVWKYAPFAGEPEAKMPARVFRTMTSLLHFLHHSNTPFPKAGRAPDVGRRSDGDAARLGSGQATPRHTKKSVYRCYLPVLAGFAAFRRMEPSRQRLVTRFVPPARRSRSGIRPCYSGLQVRPACAGRQGTATAPSSTTKKLEPTIGLEPMTCGLRNRCSTN